MILSRAWAVFFLLVVLAFVLPFELTKPLFSVGPIGITSVELPLYALLALSVAKRDAWRPRTWTPVHWAALAWAAAHLASAAAAPDDRWPAWRFALRMCAAAALVFPVGMVSRSPGRAATVLRALIAGAVLSAALAGGEVFWPGTASLLAPFKTVTAQVAGIVRAGGPFQYPNQAALYWAAALPVLVLTDEWVTHLPSFRPRASTVLGLLLLVTAIAAAGSRGGLLAAAVAVSALIPGGTVRLRQGAALALACLVAAVLVAALGHPVLFLRNMDPGGEVPWFAGHFELVGTVPELRAGEEVVLRVEVRNVGELSWETVAPTPMEVGVRWLDLAGSGTFEEPLTPLPHAVPPGAAAFVDLKVTAPEQPGRYALHFQLVGEGTSYEAPATAKSDVPIAVIGSPVPPTRARPVARAEQRQVTRLELWRAGWRMWKARPLLGVGPDGFRRLYGAYLGPRILDDRVNANSLYVETLAERGFLGVASLVFLAVSLARVVWSSSRRVREPQSLLVIASAAALLAFAVHGLFDSVLAFTPLCGLFWMHVGLIAGQASESLGEDSPSPPIAT